MTKSPREVSFDVGTELQFGPFERSVRLSRPRLQGFDYRGSYAYHVIVVVNQRTPVFTDIVFSRWSLDVLEQTAEATAFDLLAYCLMPDHLHVLTQGREDWSHLVTLLQRFKQRTGFRFKKESGDLLWQSSYFDRILREDEDLATVADYIFQNPVVAGLTSEPGAYPLSGGLYFDAGQSDRAKAPSLHTGLADSSSGMEGEA